MDKKELNKELINCLVKRSNLQREIRELLENIIESETEICKNFSRLAEARFELEKLEKLAEKYIDIKMEQQKFFE